MLLSFVSTVFRVRGVKEAVIHSSSLLETTRCKEEQRIKVISNIYAGKMTFSPFVYSDIFIINK